MKSRSIAWVAAVLIAALACAKRPEIAPEAGATQFTTTAPVPEVLDASVSALKRWAHFSISRGRSHVYALHTQVYEMGPHPIPGAVFSFAERAAFVVAAEQVRDSTQVTIIPRRGGARNWLPLGARELRLARRLSTRVQRELEQARS